MAQRIIVNADDCGKTPQVDREIEHSILEGKITSTTVMANMDDFNGAIELYRKYNDKISFGWHLNLTEGQPILYSQLLLDKGYYLESEGKVFFNGNSFRNKVISSVMWTEIKKELYAQYDKLRDSGIVITHADSHHFIHTSPGMVLKMPSLFKELKINRCRRIINYGLPYHSRLVRQLFSLSFSIKGLKMPDTFSFWGDYYNNSKLKQGKTVELMIHPGHPKPDYDAEYQKMLQTDYAQLWPGTKLISYKEL